jgi:hypothetical protein
MVWKSRMNRLSAMLMIINDKFLRKAMDNIKTLSNRFFTTERKLKTTKIFTKSKLNNSNRNCNFWTIKYLKRKA